MMVKNKSNWFSFLGLAYRARKVITGEEMVIQSVRSGQAKLVLLSKDASDRTTKTVTNKCQSFHVPIVFVENRQLLGEAIGKAERVVVTVTDPGFADKLKAMFDSITGGE
jgi:ribosomal protein L7Ae-like RNA K-turn-binding protein